MDTTSHNFVFVQDTVFGAPLTSEWYDAAIIDENNIWVGGYVLSEDYNPNYETGHKYNAAHWDGNQWEFQTLLLKYWVINNNGLIVQEWDSSGNFINNVMKIGNQVWFTNTASLMTRLIDNDWDYFENQIFQPFYYSVNAIWGPSPNNVILPGHDGIITTYNGSAFSHYTISPYEDIPFIDVWGVSEEKYWIVGHNWENNKSSLYEYNGLQWDEKYYLETIDFDYSNPKMDRLDGPIYAVWAYNDTLYISGWIGLWKESISTGKGYWTTFEQYNIGLGQSIIVKIRGQSYNDIIMLGYWGEILHYNGKDWKMVYPNQDWTLVMDSVDFKDDLVVFVGSTINYQGVIIRGMR